MYCSCTINCDQPTHDDGQRNHDLTHGDDNGGHLRNQDNLYRNYYRFDYSHSDNTVRCHQLLRYGHGQDCVMLLHILVVFAPTATNAMVTLVILFSIVSYTGMYYIYYNHNDTDNIYNFFLFSLSIIRISSFLSIS